MFKTDKLILISSIILLLISSIWCSIIIITPINNKYQVIGDVVNNKITIYKIVEADTTYNKISFVFSYKYTDDLGSHIIAVPKSNNIRDTYVIYEKNKKSLPYEIQILIKDKKVVRYRLEYTYFIPILFGIIGLILGLLYLGNVILNSEPYECRKCKIKETCYKYDKT